MKNFTDMYLQIDQTTKSNEKIQALVDFFHNATDRDKMWAIALFTHRRSKRTVPTSLIRIWAAELAEIPLWLFEESYHIVGDLAETISLVLPLPTQLNEKSLSQWINEINLLQDKSVEEKKAYITQSWMQLGKNERFLFCKLITGGFRIGISQKSITKALAKFIDVDENTIAHRLMGKWHPDDISFQELMIKPNPRDYQSKPYPFYLAYALEGHVNEIGQPDEWFAEWKWDGIRGQIIKRNGQLYIWSRGEELITDKFPELAILNQSSEDNWVIDGEIIGMKNGKPLDFNQLQTRLNRKHVTKKYMEETPIGIIAYDIIERKGKDLRLETMSVRRSHLEQIMESFPTNDQISISPIISFDNWDQLIDIRKESRANAAEGIMLKLKTGVYKTGRKKGEWWKWKIDPMTIDAVMLYAQRGHGRRANLYTDFTFAVWDEDRLVPFAKAYSGLTDEEFKEVTQFVKKNTIQRFGPVSGVEAELVFELAFEGIAASTRHKSGIALRFPRIKRWRKDKPIEEANTLGDLKILLNQY